MKRTCFFALIALLFSAGSCSKNDGTPATPIRLARVTLNGVVTEEYSYNGEGQLAKITLYRAPSVKTMEAVLTYDQFGKLTKTAMETNLSSAFMAMNMQLSYEDYTYQNGLIATKKSFVQKNGNYQQASVSNFTYDANNRVIEVLASLPTGQPYAKTTYQYDTRGNGIVTEDFSYTSGSAVLAIRHEFEYDNQLNPPQSGWVLPFSTNKNNVTKETSTIFSSFPVAPVVSVSTYAYEYTSEGYPSKVKNGGFERLYEYNR